MTSKAAAMIHMTALETYCKCWPSLYGNLSKLCAKRDTSSGWGGYWMAKLFLKYCLLKCIQNIISIG